MLEVLSAVLWLLNDSAPLPARLVGLMPETAAQLRELNSVHRRSLAEGSCLHMMSTVIGVLWSAGLRPVANSSAELYVGLLDWITERINRSLRLPLAAGSKHSSLSLLLLPASSCRGDTTTEGDGNWQALVHNYVNIRAHLVALRSEEYRLRATLQSVRMTVLFFLFYFI